jgi:acyl-coenzyme A thioesterase PaaI-like protein
LRRVSQHREYALGAVARTRAHGMHFWGQFLGISHQRTSDGRSLLRLVPEDLPPQARPSTAALATVADIALGSAVRLAVGAGRRLGTTTLSLHHVTEPQGTVVTDSEAVWVDPDRSKCLAHAVLRDETEQVVATAQGWFLVLPVPDGLELAVMPWERDETAPVGPVTDADLDDAEKLAVETATESSMRAAAHGTSAREALLGVQWEAALEGRVRGFAPVGPHIANRVGHVQGGAMYGVAAAAAARAAGPGLRLADGTMQYLRPGQGQILTVEAVPSRTGRRAAFVDVRVSVDDVLATTSSFTLLAGH